MRSNHELTEKVTVKMTKENVTWLDEQAAGNNISRSEYVRKRLLAQTEAIGNTWKLATRNSMLKLGNDLNKANGYLKAGDTASACAMYSKVEKEVFDLCHMLA